jgi:hypothetical protein
MQHAASLRPVGSHAYSRQGVVRLDSASTASLIVEEQHYASQSFAILRQPNEGCCDTSTQFSPNFNSGTTFPHSSRGPKLLMAQLALTTTFTPPASCFGTGAILDVLTTVCAGTLASCQYLVLGQAPSGSMTCMPPGYTPGGNYYSPGICPSGYTTACWSLNPVGSLTETAVTCCPM